MTVSRSYAAMSSSDGFSKVSVFGCDIDPFVCGADDPVCVDEELSVEPASEDSICRSTATGFCLSIFCLEGVTVDFVAVGVVPALILVFAWVCKKRDCCVGALIVMGTRWLLEYVAIVVTFVMFLKLLRRPIAYDVLELLIDL